MELYADLCLTAVTSGGATAPASGTQETWVVASPGSFPSASSSASPATEFHIADIAPGFSGEIIAVINCSGGTWTVIRGADSTTPVVHTAGFAVVNVVPASVLLALQARNGTLNVVQDFGADPSGVKGSGAAFSAAYAAAASLGFGGGGVYVPPGTYWADQPVVPQSNVKLSADALGAAKIFSNGNALFSMGPGTTLLNLRVENLFLSATAGDIFSGANIERSTFRDNQFQQLSAGNSIWNSTPGPGLMVECRFLRNIETVAGATRTVEPWLLQAPSNSNQVNACKWQDEVCFNNGADPNMYWWHVLSSGTGTPISDSNRWQDCTLENPLGGMIRLESCRSCIIDGVQAWDATASYANSLIRISQNGSGGTPSGNRILNSGRVSGSLAGGVYDVQLDGNCPNTKIDSPRGSSLTLNLGSSTPVTLIGLPSGYTLTGVATPVADAYLNPLS